LQRVYTEPNGYHKANHLVKLVQLALSQHSTQFSR